MYLTLLSLLANTLLSLLAVGKTMERLKPNAIDQIDIRSIYTTPSIAMYSCIPIVGEPGGKKPK